MKDPRRRGPPTRLARASPLLLTGLALVAIFAATLTPAPPAPPLPRWCIVCGALGGLDVILNVALFVPLGLGLALLWRSPWRVIAGGFAVTLAIEMLQIRVITGRDASVGDLLANTLGTALGVAVARFGAAVLEARGTGARRLALGWLLVVAGVLASTAGLLRPSQPSAPQWVQWTQPKFGFEDFTGTLLEASVNGAPVHESQRLDAGDPAHPFAHDTVLLRASLTLGPRATSGLALVTRLAGPEHEAFMLGVRGADAVFRSRLYAADARLRSPHLRLEGALRLATGSAPARRIHGDSTVLLEAMHTRDALVLRRLQPAPQIEARLPLSVALGWAMILPWDAILSPRQAALGNSLWLALLFVPLAFWARRARASSEHVSPPVSRTDARWLAPLLVGGALLVVVPLLAVGPAISLTEWAGAVAGAFTGWALGAWRSA